MYLEIIEILLRGFCVGVAASTSSFLLKKFLFHNNSLNHSIYQVNKINKNY